jgi:hypothetical protein
MIDKLSKQIIPDLESVARCSNETFVISDLLKKIAAPVNIQQSFVTQLENLHLELKHAGYSREYYLNKIEAFLGKNKITQNENETFREAIEDGINCNLLQPDARGWQKGKLKLCFEFIPEESEIVENKNNSIEAKHSPLDEIRNSLTVESN